MSNIFFGTNLTGFINSKKLSVRIKKLRLLQICIHSLSSHLSSSFSVFSSHFLSLRWTFWVERALRFSLHELISQKRFFHLKVFSSISKCFFCFSFFGFVLVLLFFLFLFYALFFLTCGDRPNWRHEMTLVATVSHLDSKGLSVQSETVP